MPRILKGTWRKRVSDLFKQCTGSWGRLWETGPLSTSTAGMWERARGCFVAHALVQDEAELLHKSGSRFK
jgi:hypothetical protein